LFIMKNGLFRCITIIRITDGSEFSIVVIHIL
jgi:hypothetical protein